MNEVPTKRKTSVPDDQRLRSVIIAQHILSCTSGFSGAPGLHAPRYNEEEASLGTRALQSKRDNRQKCPKNRGDTAPAAYCLMQQAALNALSFPTASPRFSFPYRFGAGQLVGAKRTWKRNLPVCLSNSAGGWGRRSGGLDIGLNEKTRVPQAVPSGTTKRARK